MTTPSPAQPRRRPWLTAAGHAALLSTTAAVLLLLPEAHAGAHARHAHAHRARPAIAVEAVRRA